MILFRPVGLKELELVAATDFQAFPPRLASQPIFYPVLSYDYAVQIARDWNTADPASGYAGFVLRFQVDREFAQRYPVKTVGASQHKELWVPAEELETFNEHILGQIIVEAAFYGEDYSGEKLYP